MSSTEFHIFKKNTDATATNKGFYFQYLLTLRLWLQNYNNSDFEIYCETEDDILSLDKSTNSRHYTQIKCYSSDFGLSSPEVLKSVLNFYKLFIEYHNTYNGTYVFSTNASTKPRAGKVLAQWSDKQKNGDFNADEFLPALREALIKYIKVELDEFIGESNNSSKTPNAIATANKLIEDINSQLFQSFANKIRWEFSADGADAIQTVSKEILLLLEQTEYNRNIEPEIVLSYLLEQIIKKSSQNQPQERVLTKSELELLILNTANTSAIINAIESNIIQIINEFLNTSKQIEVLNKSTNEIKNDTKLILEALSTDSFKINLLDTFSNDLRNWLLAIDYELGELSVKKQDFFYFTIKVVERRKVLNILVYGLIKPIYVSDISDVDQLRELHDCDEAWIVSMSYPSYAAVDFTNDNQKGDILCYNFDELIEQTMDLSKYFSWVEKEVVDRKINERYLPLSAKKGEFDIKTSKVIASSIYDESRGGLEGYIDTWINDTQKEHVSILGEFGTGKTWFTLFYTWEQIKKYNLAKAKRLPRPRIPILIPLRDFSKALQVDVLISDFFFRKHQIEIRGVFNAFHQLNQMGKLLLIFDGFDEMAEKINKQKVIDNFWELATIIKGQSKVILTCRNEHFTNIKEGRTLLNAEYKEATKQLTGESPQFEVVELLKFNPTQIRKLLSFVTNQNTIDLIFSNENIIDLLSRPIMIELIIDAITEIENGKPINLTNIYFFATRRKMERDISQNRTFTSLTDKLFFMREIAWHMLSNDQLTISYREFPDIIYNYFNTKAQDKELDYWRYDMRSQSMLIIDDEGGNYKPAHKSFLEFFVAYKFALELGLLKKEFNKDSNGNSIKLDLTSSSVEHLNKTFGLISITSNKMEVVSNFLVNMVDKSSIDTLWNIYNESRNQTNSSDFLSGNLLFLLTKFSQEFSNRNFTGLSLFNINFYGLNLNGSDFSNSNFDESTISNCSLAGTKLNNCKFTFDVGVPSIGDISGNNKFTFLDDNKSIISVGRLGINLNSLESNEEKLFPFDNHNNYVSNLVALNNYACIAINKSLRVCNLNTSAIIFDEPIHKNYIRRITVEKNSCRFATFTDAFGDNTGEIKIWEIKDNKVSVLAHIDTKGVFEVCFRSTTNSIIFTTRVGDIMSFDIKNQMLSLLLNYRALSQQLKNNSAAIVDRDHPYIYSLSFNADESVLAIGSTINSLAFLNIDKSKVVHQIVVDNSYVTKVKFSNNGEFLTYYSVMDGSFVVSTKDWQTVYKSSSSNDRVAFSPDSKHFAIGSSYDDPNISVLDINTLEVVKLLNRKLNFSELNIRGLIAPIWHISFYINRGAQGWYSKEELLAVSDAELESIIKGLRLENEELPASKPEKVEEIIRMAYLE
jgi:hypothetical protein